MKQGYYWLYERLSKDWHVGYFDGESWDLIGSEMRLTPQELEINNDIGPMIGKPETKE